MQELGTSEAPQFHSDFRYSVLQKYGAKVELDSNTEQMAEEEPFHEKYQR